MPYGNIQKTFFKTIIPVPELGTICYYKRLLNLDNDY